MTLTKSHRTTILLKIQSLVQKNFYDPNFNGHNWQQIVDQSRNQILDSTTTQEFETQIASMLNKLESSGLGLLGTSPSITPRNSINASFASVQTPDNGLRWVFQDVLPGGVAERAGIRPGDVLLSVAGKETGPQHKPTFQMGQSITLAVSRDGQYSHIQIDLQTPNPKYKDNPYAEPKSITTSNPGISLGRLRVSLFPGKIGIDFSNQLNAAFTDQLGNAERLVIDLRGNPGGGVGALRLMSFLTPGTQPVGYSLDRIRAEKGYDRQALPRFNKIPRSKLGIAALAFKFYGKKSVVLETEGLGSKRFHGRIVVLVNEHSTGAAEMVAQFAKENGLATIVGTKTPGHLAARSAFKLGFGYRITIPIGAYISWKGTRIEGHGINPDLSVPWSYEDARRGVDTQLDKAVEIANTL